MARDRSGSRKKSVSLAEIAEQAGVSRMTASRVLRGADGYSAATRDKVLAVARDLGYVPDRIAAAFGSDNATSLVAIALPIIGHDLYSQILEGLESQLTALGYQPIVGVVGYDDEAEAQWLNSALAWRPCGLIVAGRQRSEANRALLASLDLPIMELWNLPAGDVADDRSNILRVGLDHHAAGLQMGRHLHERYRGKAGYVGVRRGEQMLGADRFRGFSQGYDQQIEHLLLQDRSSFYAGFYGTEQLLSANPDIRVLYYLDDNMAVGGLMFCQQRDIRIPGDVAIAGFGGLDVGSILPAPLTTTRVRRLRVGKLAARNLIRRVSRESVDLVEDVGFELQKGETA